MTSGPVGNNVVWQRNGQGLISEPISKGYKQVDWLKIWDI